MTRKKYNTLMASVLSSSRSILSVISLVLFVISFLSATEAADDVPSFFVPPPPFSEGIFPCSDCHADMEVDQTRRKLDFHENIVLKHAEEQRWCLDCHNANDRDKLRYANGQLISFDESYYLCGQCHGTIFRDWKAGVHGKRTGYWNGKKQYRLCVHCHNPHSPKFEPLAPLPPPIRPDELGQIQSTESEVPRNPLESLLESESKHVEKE